MTRTQGRREARQELDATAGAINALTQPVFERLEALALENSEVLALETMAHGRLSDQAISHLEMMSVAAIREIDLVIGAGMAVTAPELTGGGLMHWWILHEDAVVSKRHVLNPSSDTFYDFSNSRWFRIPARRGTATLIAPYVDSWGTDDLTITAAIPVPLHRPHTTAIVAVDLNARIYLQSVEEILQRTAPAALIDAEGRAVASTRPEIETGVRLASLGAWRVTRRVDIPQLEWSVAQLERAQTSRR